MQELTERILEYLDKHDNVNTLDLVPVFNEDHQKIVGAVKSIIAHDEEMIGCEQTSKKQLELTEEGKTIAQNGSHEANVYNAVPEAGIPQAELMKV